jgi:uncharacterized membrane protein
MKTRKEYRAAALSKIRGNWTPLVLAMLVFMAVGGIAGSTTFAAPLVTIFVVLPIEVALYNCFLAFDRDQSQNGIIEGMFKKAFTGEYLHRVLGMFLMELFICLWTCLLIIPGIIKGLAYSMTPFILEEKPELSAYDAIKYSEKLMKGHKTELFLLYLSFIGWAILCVFTFGIGYLWLAPYIYVTLCEFYEDLKKETPLEGTVSGN